MVTPAVKLNDVCSLEEKNMTNLDSKLKSRDITLPANIHLVKAMVFPVVKYGYESWTIKKAAIRVHYTSFRMTNIIRKTLLE